MKARILLSSAFISLHLILVVVQAQAPFGQNLILNSHFRVQKYIPDPKNHTQMLPQAMVPPWSQTPKHLIQLTTQAEFPLLSHEPRSMAHALPIDKDYICVLRQSQTQQIHQNTKKMGNLLRGKYGVAIKVIAKKISPLETRIIQIVLKNGKISLKKTFSFPTDGKMHELVEFIDIQVKGKYNTSIFSKRSGIVGFTQLRLLSPYYINNGDFSEPDIPKGRDLLTLQNTQAGLWSVQGRVDIVKCNDYNPSFQCDQALMFASCPEKSIIFQQFTIKTILGRKYCLGLEHKEAIGLFHQGQVQVFLNSQRIFVIEKTKFNKAHTRYVYIPVELQIDSNQMLFQGINFDELLSGILLKNVRIQECKPQPIPPRQKDDQIPKYNKEYFKRALPLA